MSLADEVLPASLPGFAHQVTGSPSLLTGVVLPDGTYWEFDYNSYGDIATMHLPTAGQIAYSYAYLIVAMALSEPSHRGPFRMARIRILGGIAAPPVHSKAAIP
jgi:YD repeat-containing protein